MARNKNKRLAHKDLPVGDPNDPEGLFVWMKRYLSWLAVHNYAERTVVAREGYLRLFLAWADGRGVTRPAQVTLPILERYQSHVFEQKTRAGKPLAFPSQHNRLVPLRAFFKWLTRQRVLSVNPASELVLPKLERRLPRAVLNEAEIETVLAIPDTTDVLGLRDRAILETFYSTAMRRTELCRLGVWDIDAERGTALIVRGKGKRDRVVPIGERALLWLGRYREHARPELVVPPDEGVLFLSRRGDPLAPNYLTGRVSRIIASAKLGKRGACHLFRHSVATIMLDNGADIRFIQELLGHVEVSTTQIYTQVSIRALKRVHARTHPSAKLDDSTAEAAAGDDANHAPQLDELWADLRDEAED